MFLHRDHFSVILEDIYDDRRFVEIDSSLHSFFQLCILPSNTINTMPGEKQKYIKLQVYVQKKDGISDDEFHKHWADIHGDECKKVNL